MDDSVMDEKVGRTMYVLYERWNGVNTWSEVASSYFEDDMDDLFNEKYQINGHDTYYQIVEMKVIRRA